MKKLIITAATICIFTGNAFAASVTTNPNSNGHVCSESTTVVIATTDNSIPIDTTSCSSTANIIYSTKTTSGGVISQMYTTKYCTACKSGYTLTETSAVSTNAPNCKVTYTECLKIQTIMCSGLPCAGASTWITYSGQTGNETRCNSSTNKCEYRCAAGYYQSGFALVTNPVSCKTCPTNATCAAGTTKPSCNKGYYLNNTSSTTFNPTYTCPRCPSSGGVYGTTAAAGAKSITSCYIASGTSFTDTTGTWTYSSNCYYSE